MTPLKSYLNDGILFFESENKDFQWYFDTRIYIDGAYYFDNLNDLGSGTELRKGRFGIKTKLYQNWLAELDINVSDDELEVKDAYLRYNFSKNTFIKIGNFKEPFGLEKPTTSRNLEFMERSYLEAFVPDRHIGISLSHFDNGLYGSLGLFGQEINDLDNGEDEGWAITSRIAYAPVFNNNRVAHFGFSVSRRTPDAEGTSDSYVKFGSRPETHISRTEFLNTKKINDVKYDYRVGVEGAWVRGPFSLQSEYIQVEVIRNNLENALFSGWYAMATYTLTGESRPYNVSEAELSRIVPENKFGAFEVALRYSNLDLNDFNALILGGEAENYTIGFNWYANKNVKCMLNYSYVNNDRYANGNGELNAGYWDAEAGKGGDDFSFLQMRFEIDF